MYVFLESCMNLHCFKAWRGRGPKGTEHAFPPRLQEDRVRVPAAGGCGDVCPGNRRRRNPAQVSFTTADSRRWQYALDIHMLCFTGETMKKASHGLSLSFWIESPSLPSSRRESATPCFEWLIWGWSAQQRCSCVTELISTLKVRRWGVDTTSLWFCDSDKPCEHLETCSRPCVLLQPLAHRSVKEQARHGADVDYSRSWNRQEGQGENTCLIKEHLLLQSCTDALFSAIDSWKQPSWPGQRGGG